MLRLAAFLLCSIPCQRGAAGEIPAGVDDVSDVAREVVADHELPGLAIAAVVDGKFRATGFAGVRNLDDESVGKVELDDRFHIGSITKAFTATLAAKMVEEGRIRWDTKAADLGIFPEIHEGFGGLTLEHLLANCGGLPKDVPKPIWHRAWATRGDLRKTRLDFAKTMLGREPEFEPGSEFGYSNAGYAIAGVMLESRSEDRWETLVRKRIFEPLSMKSAGFRAPAADPADPTKVRKQPWGHRDNGGPVPPEPFGDNPVAIAPSGAIHCSVIDLARFAYFHVMRRPAPIFKDAKTFAYLHRPRHENYALGWVVLEREWAGGPVLNHFGSNTMFSVVVWVAPEKKFAVAVATNIAPSKGEKACDHAAVAMVKRYVFKEARIAP